MAFINRANKKVTARIIYYGPDQAGKNTSLLYIYHHVPEKSRGKLVSLATEQGSKISFEYHPDAFDSSSYDFLIQLNTVSGQVTNEKLRQALVNGADGCVFLADMQPSCQFANFKCYQSLEEDLRACGRNLKEFPLIIQYNKMDLPNILPVGKMNLFLNSYNVQFFETCATSGTGVLETLNCITALVWNDLNNKGILIGAAHSISKSAAVSVNEPGISVIGSSDENSAVALLQQAHEPEVEKAVNNFQELEGFDVSSDAAELEIDYEDSEMSAVSFEENFELDELLQLADKIGPKGEQDTVRHEPQHLESQPLTVLEQPPEPVFADMEEEEVFAEIDEVEEPVSAPVEEPFELENPVPIESPVLLEVPSQPAAPAAPETITAKPEPEPPAPLLPQTNAPAVQPVHDLPPATAALFAGDIRIQVLFSYLETAISNKDFNSVKNISDQTYSYLLDRLAQKRGVSTMNAGDASKWLADLGISTSQQSLYQNAISTLSTNQNAALSDLFLIHYFLLTFQTKLTSFPEIAAATAEKLVSTERVSKRYTLGNYQVQALKNVTMNVQNGEFLAIAGPSGSGKTTLLNLIGCIDTPSGGTITIDDRVVNGLSSDELADLRARTIGFIFQTFNLLPVLSAAENVEYPLLQIEEVSKGERKARVNHCLAVVGLSSVAFHKPNELSGGQRQRVAIARALAVHPKIILADEPTANLDHKTGESILQLMKEINRSEKTTFVFSTHDPRVMELADRVVRMNDGEVINS
jgi:putative ABC transport system ATP-binding protein